MIGSRDGRVEGTRGTARGQKGQASRKLNCGTGVHLHVAHKLSPRRLVCINRCCNLVSGTSIRSCLT